MFGGLWRVRKCEGRRNAKGNQRRSNRHSWPWVAALALACFAVGCAARAPTGIECATIEDLETVGFLLGRESIGEPEPERVRLLEMSNRIAASVANCLALTTMGQRVR